MPRLLDEGRAAKNGSKEVICPHDVKIWTTGLRLRGSVPPLCRRQILHMTFEALKSRFLEFSSLAYCRVFDIVDFLTSSFSVILILIYLYLLCPPDEVK